MGSAGSIGANYREANDALSKKDFVHRLRISRKEAKEALHWIEMLAEANESIKKDLRSLYQEGKELKHILSTIISKNT